MPAEVCCTATVIDLQRDIGEPVLHGLRKDPIQASPTTIQAG
jgi:hypothetical protein